MMPEEKSFEVWNDYGVENFDEMVNLCAAFLKSFLANFDVDTEGEWAEFADYFDTKYGWSVYEISPSEKTEYVEELESDEDYDMWYESLCDCADDYED